MSQMAALLKRFDPPEGYSQSPLDGVRFFKSSKPIPRSPLLYDPGLCIVAQGHKVGYLADRVFQYDSENYLVTSITMPFECESFATPEQPLLGLYVTVDIPTLYELIDTLDITEPQKQGALPHAMGPAPLEPELHEAVVNLLTCLGSQQEMRVLGKARVREVLYRALCGKQASSLYALASHDGHFSRIADIIRAMHHDCARKLDVELLAGQALMSPSAFHRAFREITSDSPIQYLKKIRLSKARDLIVGKSVNVAMAADQVGYESPSQFSREFKRHFGMSPTALIRQTGITRDAS